MNLFAQDTTSAVSRGKKIQYKQLTLGQGLHNLTGSRKVIDILHTLGHCISYNTVCEIETAQAECALEGSKSSNILALKTILPHQTVFTHFWVDNVDIKVDWIRDEGQLIQHISWHFNHIASQTLILPQSRERRVKCCFTKMSQWKLTSECLQKTGKESIQKFNMQCRKKGLFQESVCHVDLHSKADQF